MNRNERELNERKSPARVVGLTGGIASGKTVATDALIACGIKVIDADEIARELTVPGGELEREMALKFPKCVSAGRLDRRALRALIASDSSARALLNSITHPEIIGQIKNRLRETDGPVVISAPLLFETGLAALCDATVCITAPRMLKIQRLKARDGVNDADAAAMIDAQIPDTYRATLADYCIPSDTDIGAFRSEVTELFSKLMAVDCHAKP